MARGWESKAVESQQSEAESARPSRPTLTPEAREKLTRHKEVALSLARVRDQLSRAVQPAHREMLERAAAALEAELSGLSS